MAYAVLERTFALEPSSAQDNCSNVFEACYNMQLLAFHLNLPLDAISAVCYQFGLFSTDLHLIPCAGFVETFN